MFNPNWIGSDRLPVRAIVLTYDDGPGPNTLPIAEYLRDEGIAATFFVVGKYADERRDVLARVRNLGHRLGNHTWTHDPVGLPKQYARGDDIASELRRTAALLDAAAGRVAFRAPYGLWDATVATALNTDTALAAAHVGPVGWDVDDDWREWRDGIDPAIAAERYHAAIRAAGRGIVLLHDYAANDDALAAKNRTAELTRALVPALIADGFRFAPLDAMI